MGKECSRGSALSKRGLILVEGPTEERFVKDTLAPFFYQINFFISPTILVTKKVKSGPNFKGGVTNFAKFENDLNRLLSSAGGALVTTMLDYYRLPNDFPGMATRPSGTSPSDRVRHVEKAVEAYFGNPQNLLVFFALHEFEAWLFSSTEELPRVMTDTSKELQFTLIRIEFETPEEINEKPGCAPSQRIQQIFPAYRKTFHGPVTAGRIGLDRIRQECTHFDWWITQLEQFAAS